MKSAPSLSRTIAYAAPAAGAFFFYIPMWSILPAIYSKYFGLSLSAVAAVLLALRIFDGAIIPIVGYFSDRHRAAGGSRKSWVVVGYLGVLVACFFLFNPPEPATATFYLGWSLIFFLAFMIAEIPHTTWGSELTLDYQQRAYIFGVRTSVFSVGVISFYGLPLLPQYPTSDYTPQVLRDAVYIGGGITMVGLMWLLVAAPASVTTQAKQSGSVKLLLRSVVRNRPLQLYFAAFATTAVCYGMWFGLIYFFLDSYLGHGPKIALIFLLSHIVAGGAIPIVPCLIRRTSKSALWAFGVVLFALQLIGSAAVRPGDTWLLPFFFVFIAHLCFNCHNVAALSTLGDIADYARLKFRQDYTATYFALNNLIFQVSVGVGGGLALAIAGSFNFNPTAVTHTTTEVVGLKLGFVVVPVVLLLLALPLILAAPITRQRHQVIQRRLQLLHPSGVP